MTQFTADHYKQAELIIMRRDSVRHWRTHLKLLITGLVLLLPVTLIAGRLGAFALVAAAWLTALGVHYLYAFRWFDRAKNEFQGRVDYVAQQLSRSA